ncbi:MAG: ATP-binding protein [Planctomycetaceae bacterium]|nr:ATP-binding protein [Planctomycetaceae bacterium]
MRNITGNPVSGRDFHGRRSELKSLRRAIENGNHVLILAPRRVGKSSVVLETERLLTESGWKVISIDVQHAEDEAGFLQLIYEAIDESPVELEKTLGENIRSGISSIRSMLRGFKGGAAGVQLEVAENESAWEEAANPLRAQIKRLAKAGDRVLIAMDELPIFLSRLLLRPDGNERVPRILNWLRSVRQACQSNLPWVMCGSIGLDTFVQNHGLEGSINDLTEMSVGAFSIEDATGLLQRLAAAEPEIEKLPNEVTQAILDRVGWLLPYYLQLMFHALISLPDDVRSNNYPSVEDVAKAYMSAARTKNLGHWSSRLNDLLTQDEKRRAHLLLDRVAAAADGSTREDLRGVLVAAAPQTNPEELERHLRKLLKLLSDDGYVSEEGGRVRFRSFLLRDFWKQEYAQ